MSLTPTKKRAVVSTLVAIASTRAVLLSGQGQSAQQGPKVPDRRDAPEYLPGFVVERVNPAKIDSYVAMTFNAEGRPLVAKEFDYLRWLHRSGRRRALRVRTHPHPGSPLLSGHLVRWPDALCHVHGERMPPRKERPSSRASEPSSSSRTQLQPGSTARLWRERGEDPRGPLADCRRTRSGEATSVALVTQLLGTVEEHGPHGLRRGPDGELWYTVGDDTGRRSIATSTASGRSCSMTRKRSCFPASRTLAPASGMACARRAASRATRRDRQAHGADGRQPQHVQLRGHRDG